jgi:hypothetical protein
VAAFAGPLPRIERARQGPGTVETGDEVAEGFAHHGGRPVRLAGEGHQSALGLDDKVVGGPVAKGAGLSEAGDAEVDQAGVQRR